jgi:hypothetical protein
MNITTTLGAAGTPDTGAEPALDDLLDLWRATREEARDAYETWSRGRPAARHLNYAVFLAAADREEAAEREVLRAVGNKR